MNLLKTISLAAAASLLLTAPVKAGVVVSYEGEEPGIQNTTATFTFSGVETFDDLPVGTGTPSFSQTFADAANPATTITSNFSGANGVQINSADQYGGAGGTGNYIVAFNSTPFTLNLSSQNLAGGINYFGYWLSALDAGNTARFYGDNGQLLFAFNPQDVLNVVTKNLNNGQYYGNPNGNFSGQNGNEPYIFLNFFNPVGTFTKVEFEEAPTFGGGYESDNYTFGHYTTMGTGTIVPTPISDAIPAVPELGTWAMMLIGFGTIGASVRKRPRGLGKAIAA